MNKIIKNIFLVILFAFSNYTFAQTTSGAKASEELRQLIDLPTAGILSGGTMGLNFDILQNGILISKLELAVMDNLSLGISYGGSNIIGAGTPDLYIHPGFDIKFRLIKESLLFPSITLGYNSQGVGKYDKSLKRYEIKSKGFYAAVTKNYNLLGYLSLHGVINYSYENKDGDSYINFGVGFEKTIGPFLSVMSEYDFALNDNSNEIYGKGSGYLNVGLRFSLGIGLSLGMDLRNILENKKNQPYRGVERAVRVEYLLNIY